jgi:hypothetical protein
MEDTKKEDKFIKKNRKKIVISFWILWVLFIISTYTLGNVMGDFSMLGLWLAIISFAGFPIIGLILLAILPKKKPAKPVITEAEMRAEKEKAIKERMINEEKIRIEMKKEIEKYSIRKIGIGWEAIPFILFFILGFFLIMGFKNDDFNWYLAIGVALCATPMWVVSIESEWDKRLECKRELDKEDSKNAKLYLYDYDKVYTDSQFQYFFYKTTKILCYLITITGVGLLGFLGILWLGSITIAPTTIIIILLIIIIVNQNNNKR